MTLGGIKMTRKQAVLDAIRILGKNKKNIQTVELLKEIYEELPLTHWSEKSILDAFAEFLLENDRLPTKKDLCVYLPSLKTIVRIFKVSGLIEFEKKYFPHRFKNECRISPYWWYSKDDFKNCFIRNYNTINGGLYIKYDDYNLYREPGTPTLKLIIEKMECNSYNELLEKTGIKKKKEPLSIQSNKRTIKNIFKS